MQFFFVLLLLLAWNLEFFRLSSGLTVLTTDLGMCRLEARRTVDRPEVVTGAMFCDAESRLSPPPLAGGESEEVKEAVEWVFKRLLMVHIVTVRQSNKTGLRA